MTSSRPSVVRSARLELVAGTVELTDAELAGRDGFASLLRCKVPPSWPPGEYDHGAIEHLRNPMLRGGFEATGWYTWYAITLDDAGARDMLVGAGGYFGPPEGGVVELGYSVVPEARRRGFATEMTRALLDHARNSSKVRAAIAHTFESNLASVRVLEHCGFLRVNPAEKDGRTRFRLDLSGTPQPPP